MDEQERARLVGQLEELREGFESLSGRIEAVRSQTQALASTLAQAEGARQALEKYASGEAEDEVLVPVGADAFFHGKLATNGRAVVGIGAGVFLDMPVVKGKEIYEKRIDEIKGALTQMEHVRTRLDQQQREMAAQYNQLVEIAQAEGAGGPGGPQPVQFFPDEKEKVDDAQASKKRKKGRKEED
jgi:prefoldin alpha subunit